MGQGELFKDVESMDFSSGITQTCMECNKIKPSHLFDPLWRRKDGSVRYSNKCRDCRQIQQKIKDGLRKHHPYPNKDYRCPMCGDSEEDLKTKSINSHTSRNTCKETFSLDHNHQTGEFNDYICHTCNSKVAWNMGNDPVKNAKQLLKYVEKHYG